MSDNSALLLQPPPKKGLAEGSIPEIAGQTIERKTHEEEMEKSGKESPMEQEYFMMRNDRGSPAVLVRQIPPEQIQRELRFVKHLP
jgi:hypothetical protein